MSYFLQRVSLHVRLHGFEQHSVRVRSLMMLHMQSIGGGGDGRKRGCCKHCSWSRNKPLLEKIRYFCYEISTPQASSLWTHVWRKHFQNHKLYRNLQISSYQQFWIILLGCPEIFCNLEQLTGKLETIRKIEQLLTHGK